MPGKFGLLATLYVSQGLPYGFFTTAFPFILRSEGFSQFAVGASAILMLPWGLKFLWAPVVDKYAGSPLGARRGWIWPLQLITICACVLLALVPDAPLGAPLARLMTVAVVVLNLLAATQDIPTDALAVDLLSERDRGVGNGIQVAAYRVGMIIGGGALVGVLATQGWRTTMLGLAALSFLVSLPIAVFREPRREHASDPSAARVTLDAAISFLGRKNVAPWVGLVALYKFGDALLGPMARTMLVDRGMSLVDMGVLFGTWGSGAGLAGAMAGGVLAQRIGRKSALVVGGVAHTLLIAAYAWPAFDHSMHATSDVISALVVLEHFTGGMATVALFTAMMDVCDPRTGGTDYTVQACVVVWTQFFGSVLSGASAQSVGYGPHFVVAALVSLVGVLVMTKQFANRPFFPLSGFGEGARG